MEQLFYKTENGVLLSVCGGAPGLDKLLPGTSEGAVEKHLPEVKVDGSRVSIQVGSVPHPMTEEHSIDWVYLQTCCGGYLRYFKAEQEPEAEFTLAPEETLKAVYAYCNLHGFWKTEL